MAGARQKIFFDPSAPGFSGVLTEPSSFMILSPSTVTFTIKGIVAQVDGNSYQILPAAIIKVDNRFEKQLSVEYCNIKFLRGYMKKQRGSSTSS